jgi:hypothetical protein
LSLIFAGETGPGYARLWSFYIFSSGGGADELLICGFDFEFLKKLGALRHFFA